MYKKCIKMVLVATSLLLAISGCHRNDHKIDTTLAVLDVQKILEQSPFVKSLNDKINQELEPLRQSVKAQQKDLEAHAKKLQESSSMKKSALTKLQNAFFEQRKKLFEAAATLEKQTVQKENESLKLLYEKLDRSIAEYNQQRQYPLVLKKSYVLYESEKLNITDSVEELFNNDNKP